jgi:hypothetical protein
VSVEAIVNVATTILLTQDVTEIVVALNLALAVDTITFDELCRSLILIGAVIRGVSLSTCQVGWKLC